MLMTTMTRVFNFSSGPAALPVSVLEEAQRDLVALPGVVGTHHIGASTDQAQEAIAAETVRIVKSFKDSGEVPNAVN